MKKYIAWLLTIVMVLSMLPALSIASLAAETVYTYGDYTYTVSGSYVTIVGYKGTATSLSIPKKISSKTVRTIGARAFYDKDTLSSVTIQSGVTTISAGAFQDCSNLSTLTIPSTVTSIGEQAFYNCGKLTAATIPSGVTTLPSRVFANCISLTRVTIPSTVTSIGNFAFYFCRSLSTATLPSSLTAIGNYAFYYCEALPSVTLPGTLLTIGDAAFYYCTQLPSVSIPASVTSVGEIAFLNCSALTQATFASRTTTIGTDAFGNVSGGDMSYSGITMRGESYSPVSAYAEAHGMTFESTGYTGTAHTVTYVNNGSTTTEQIPDGSTITLPTPDARTGYAFAGWNSSADNQTYSAGTERTITAAITFTAVWIAKRYTVYYSDGGEVTSVKANYNSVITLPTPEGDGQDFGGWKCSLDNQIYAAGASYTVKSSVTFTAQWSSSVCTVTYSNNGSVSSVHVNSGATVTLTTPVRYEYDFNGWLCSANGTVYPGGTVYTVTSNVTFTAQFTIKPHTITYNNDGETSTTHVNYGDTVMLFALQKTGYTFVGWRCSIDNQLYYEDDMYTVIGNTTLTAQWTPISYCVTYHNDGAVSTVNAAYQTSITLPSPEKASYRFAGWRCSLDSQLYTGGAGYTVNGAVSFTAEWTLIKDTDSYTVWFDPADDDTDVFITGYTGSDADVVVPAVFDVELNSGTVERYTTGVRAGVFYQKPTMKTLTFPNTPTPENPDYQYATNFPIIEQIAENPELETISVAYGTRIFSATNWPDNGLTTQGTIAGTNDGIYGNPKLTAFDVPNGNKFGLCAYDGVLCGKGSFFKNTTVLLHFPEGRLGYQALPTEATVIYANAFYKNTETMTVNGQTITGRQLYLDASHIITVGAYGFSQGTALKTIDLRSCTSIGDGAFYGWTAEEKAALTIKGYPGSYVQNYCLANGIGFASVACTENHTTTTNYTTVYANDARNLCRYVHVCNTCGDVIASVTQHTTFTVVSRDTEPTCTANGVATATCERCGETDHAYVLPALGHNYVAVVTAPTETEQGYTTHTCTRCNDTYVDAYTDPTGPIAPTPTTVQFGKSIRLGATINLNVIVNAASSSSNPIPTAATDVKATMWHLDENGDRADIVVEDIALGGVVTLSYDKLPAYALMTTVYVQVSYTCNGVDYISQEYSTSAAAYCAAQLGKTTISNTLRTLMVDLLNYGSAAQINFGENIDNLANQDIDAYQSEATASNPEMADVGAITGTGVAVGASLSLKNRVEIKYQIPKAQLTANGMTLTAANSYLRVTRRDTGEYVDLTLAGEEETAYNFYYAGLSAFEFDVVVDAVLYIDGAAVSKTRTYSIYTYLTRNVENADVNLANLCTMLSRYGAAAKAYVANPNG